MVAFLARGQEQAQPNINIIIMNRYQLLSPMWNSQGRGGKWRGRGDKQTSRLYPMPEPISETLGIQKILGRAWEHAPRPTSQIIGMQMKLLDNLWFGGNFCLDLVQCYTS